MRISTLINWLRSTRATGLGLSGLVALAACSSSSHTADPVEGPPAIAAPQASTPVAQPAAPQPAVAPSSPEGADAAVLAASLEQARARYRREYYALGEQVIASADPKPPLESFLGPWESWANQTQQELANSPAKASLGAWSARVDVLANSLKSARARSSGDTLAAMKALDVWK